MEGLARGRLQTQRMLLRFTAISKAGLRGLETTQDRRVYEVLHAFIGLNVGSGAINQHM